MRIPAIELQAIALPWLALRLGFLLGLTLSVAVAPAAAQSVAGLGAITGVVTDPSGAVIPGAQIEVINEERGIRRELASSSGGLFTAASLTPAAGYVVKAGAEGFAPYELTGVEVLVGQVIDLQIRLEVGQTATEVVVSAAPPIIESTDTGVDQVVGSEAIVNLPINGRRVDSFVLLTPGVTNDGTFGLVSFRGQAGGNAFLTDGNDTTNQFNNENAGRTRISSNISQDAVQEFRVETSGYSAEFGRAIGGVVNTVTRSGSNDVHGTGYWFYRDENLNAQDRYADFVPEETRYQLGGSVGGPIIENELFYFFNVEATRRDFPIVSSLTRPPLFNSSGEFIGQCDASPAQCDAARGYFDRFFGTVDREADQELAFGKLDFRPSEKHSVTASFNYLRWISPNGIQTSAALTNGAALGSNGISTVRTRFGRLSWTAIARPTLVNEFRFGWFKDRLFDTLNPEILPTNGLLSRLDVDGVNNVGVANYMPRVQPTEDRFQFANTSTWTKGRHLVKFGFDIAHLKDIQDQLFNGRGTYVYDNFTDFALDFSDNPTGEKRWLRYTQAFGEDFIKLWLRDFSFFIQDQYRVAPRLTLDLGLRYEFVKIKQPENPNPAVPATANIPEPLDNWGPRAGLAYSFNKDRTVMRGGYGLFYARFPTAMVSVLHLRNGVMQRSITLQGNREEDLAAGPVFPDFLPSLDRQPPAGSVSIQTASPDLTNGRTHQFDVGVEHALTSTLGVNAQYLFSRAQRLTTIQDINIGPPGDPVTWDVLDFDGNVVDQFTTPTYLRDNRVNPDFARINEVGSDGNNYYDALVVQVNARKLPGLGQRFNTQATVSYTLSNARDENLGGASSNLFFSGGPRTFAAGPYEQERGRSSLYQRHRLVYTTISDLNFSPNNGAFARFAANNWQLSMIGTFGSPFFTTPTIQTRGVPFEGAAFNGTINGFGGSNRVPFLDRGSIEIDEIARVDARITKQLPFSERFRLNLFFEAFNVFNNISDTGVINRFFVAQNGQLSPQTRVGEGTQSRGTPDGTNARRAQFGLRFIF